MSESGSFEGWAILELMGHRKLGGYVSEQTIAGAAFLRIDVPATGDGEGQVAATQFYSPSAIYAITPTTETLAAAMAARYQPEPVTRWELPQLPEPTPNVTTNQVRGRFFGPADDDIPFEEEDDDDEDVESARHEVISAAAMRQALEDDAAQGIEVGPGALVPADSARNKEGNL